jgi:phage terminase large subunit-like protein
VTRSLAEELALLPEEERNAALEGLDPQAVLYDPNVWLRPEQQAPKGDWRIFGIVSGRGFGKTRAGAEWVRAKAKEQPGTRFFLVARTSADVRDTMVNGESGILNVHPPSERPDWSPSNRMLKWPNGCTALTFSAEEPNQLRGPQAHYAWCDELAAWSFKPDDVGLNAWSNVNIATRLVPAGGAPQIMFTTTPKMVPDDDVVKLLKGEVLNTVITRGSIYDNSSNLSQEYLDFITGLYGGTRLGRQELEGLLLDRSEGALWTFEMIEGARMGSSPPLPLRVVAVDPSVAERPRDECGIVVVGATDERSLHDRHAWVLEDATVHGSPDTWARAVVAAARRWRAPIVAEGNQGHALVKLTLQNIDPRVPVFMVNAQQNKHIRAEAVVGAYEQGRVHHVGRFADLESQLMTWVPEDTKSPDRLDALVWGLTSLLVKPPEGLGLGPLRAKSPARRSMALEGRAGSRGGGKRPARLAWPR